MSGSDVLSQADGKCQKAFIRNINNLAAMLYRITAHTNHAANVTSVQCDAMAFCFLLSDCFCLHYIS